MALVLLLCGVLATFVTGIYSCEESGGQKCDNFTMLNCTYHLKQSQLCSPTLNGSFRIKSVHLDTSFPRRNCLNTTHFGITEDGQRIWTANYCFGTFCVCYEREDETNKSSTGPSKTTTNKAHPESSPTTETTVVTEPSTSSVRPTFTSDAATSGLDTGDTTTLKTINVTMTTDSIMDIIRNQTTMLQGRNRTSKGIFSFLESISDETLKIILITLSSIGTLAVVLTVILIVCCCCGRSKKSNKTYKEPKLSSSALVTAELLNEPNIYESIPADRPSALTTTHQSSAVMIENVDENDVQPTHQYFTLAPHQMCSSCVPAGNTSKDNNASKHEYFKLLPNACKFCKPTQPECDKNVYNHAQEGGVYDKLLPYPRSSVSDGSTYHHLWAFSREGQCPTYEEVATQT